MPDLVDSLSQDLQDQHLDDGVEFIVFFNTILVKNLWPEILPLTARAIASVRRALKNSQIVVTGGGVEEKKKEVCTGECVDVFL